MKEYLILAYRNIWRNKKRTLIIILSISFALSSVIFMNGITLGMHQKSINNAVQSYAGYFQIQADNYFDEKIIDNSFNENLLESSFLKNEAIIAYSGRLESSVLASNGLQTKGALIVGVDPVNEDKLTKISDQIIEGKLFTDNGIVIGKGLAKYLKAKIGDKIVLVGQGYHGYTAAGEYTVEGIIHYPAIPDLDRQIIYIPLKVSQDLFSAYGMLTSVAFDIENPNELDKVVNYVEDQIKELPLAVIPWNKTLASFEAMLKRDMKSMQMIMFILYIIVGFGIMGTVLMMTVERRREFGIMLAVGMKKIQIRITLMIEMLMLIILGILSIIPLTLPSIYYLHNNPMAYLEAKAKQLEMFGYEPYIFIAWQADYMLYQVLVVFVIACAVSIIPIYRSTRIKNLPDTLKL